MSVQSAPMGSDGKICQWPMTLLLYRAPTNDGGPYQVSRPQTATRWRPEINQASAGIPPQA